MREGDTAPGLQMDLVREPGALTSLDADWRELAEARGNAFVTPEWFWAWHRHYGADHDLLVCVARDRAGALVGLLPLVAEPGRGGAVRFAGSSLGDYFHPVARAGLDEAVAGASGSLLRSEPRFTRMVVAENVDAEADWWVELSRTSGCGQHPLVERHSVLPHIMLEGRSWQEYLGSRSRNLRSQLGRKRRSLERDHQLEVRWTGTGDDLERDMAMLFRLHDMRWDARSGMSSLTSPRARAFHTDFAAALAERGWLRLCFLEADSEPVAGWYGWRVGRRFAYYQAGFDPAWSDRSVGMVLFAETIRAAAAEGAAVYDMLLGDEAFKGRFADESRPVLTAVIAPRWRPARLLAAADMRARSASRRLPDPVREGAKRRARWALERLPMTRKR
jgi:CelD/BcsL family acetyltransferase involved in cellulose biosynthesis